MKRGLPLGLTAEIPPNIFDWPRIYLSKTGIVSISRFRTYNSCIARLENTNMVIKCVNDQIILMTLILPRYKSLICCHFPKNNIPNTEMVLFES